ncbi:GNAT family N-acetyltransferase [Flavobacteriaceae bacterium D16]|nr:GNAT family N-acetyltransferase [Flavobacteriaceae bacterium D16]
MKESTSSFIDISKKKEYRLSVKIIRSTTDFRQYKDHLRTLPENPFVSEEMLRNTGKQDVGYFTLHNSSNILLILLPFIIRKIYIEQKDTGYLDIISPYGLVGPLIASHIEEDTMKMFWAKVDNWYSKNNVVSEFVRFNVNKNYIGFSGTLVPTLKTVCGKIITESEQWKNFKPKVRNNVRKAHSLGLNFNIYRNNDISLDIVNEFYHIYCKTLKRHDAEERYNFELNFLTTVIKESPTNTAIAMVYKKKRPISTELLLLSGGVVYSFLGGTDEEFFYCRPNDLLKYNVINWARENGFKHYFLGGGRSDKDSLYRYKKSFFPKDRDLSYFTGKKIVNQEIYDKLVSLNPHCVKNPDYNFFPFYRMDK